MANEVTENKCLEAELLLGYKYFQQKNAFAAKSAELTSRLQSAKNVYAHACGEYEADRNAELASESYFERTYPQEKEGYQAHCQELQRQAEERKRVMQAQLAEQKLADKKEQEKYASKRFWIFFLIGIALAALTVFMSIKGCEGASTPADASPLASLAVFVGAGAITCIGLAFGGFEKAEDENAQTETSQGFLSNPVELPSFRTYLVNKNGYSYYVQNYPEKSERYLQRERELAAQVTALETELSALEKSAAELAVRGEEILKKINVIPAYYFTEDAVSKMLFFYVNKRADTIKELINLYEQTEFEGALLKAVKNISINVDKLKQAVDGEFIRLGAQLGVLRQSVEDNAEQQRLNREKLSEIEDKNERYYFDIIDEMHSLELEGEIKIS